MSAKCVKPERGAAGVKSSSAETKVEFEQLRGKVVEMARKKPEKSAKILTTWMNGTQVNKKAG